MIAPDWLATRAIEKLMNTEPWALVRLQPFAGQTLLVHLGAQTFAFVITTEGALQPQATPPENPTLTLDFPPPAIPLVLAQPGTLLNHLRLSGNSALAAEIGFLAKHFRPDLEELLSQWVGDIAAHRLGRLWRWGRDWLRDTTRRNATMVREYAQEEAQLLPTRAQMTRFAAHVDHLHDDLAQLEQRLARLI